MKNQNSLDITSITSLGGDAYKRKISKSFWQNSISQKFAEWWWSTCLAWSCHPTPPILLTIGIIISLSFWLTDRLTFLFFYPHLFQTLDLKNPQKCPYHLWKIQMVRDCMQHITGLRGLWGSPASLKVRTSAFPTHIFWTTNLFYSIH